MLGKLLALSVIALSLIGCSILKGEAVPLGVNDWVEIPVGAKVCGVPLPTDETGKTYCVVTKKPSALVSMDGFNEMGK